MRLCCQPGRNLRTCFASNPTVMPYSDKSPDELIELIYQLVERLVNEGPEEGRHDRANLGNEIVLCAAVLRQRIGDSPHFAEETARNGDSPRTASAAPATPELAPAGPPQQ